MKLLEPAEEPGSIAGFLSKAVEPPVGPAMDHAITLLQVRLSDVNTTSPGHIWSVFTQAAVGDASRSLPSHSRDAPAHAPCRFKAPSHALRMTRWLVLARQDIGALEAGREKLTLLGRHLAALPLPPRVGKLLLYGVLFRCLDPVLTIACAMAFRCVEPQDLHACETLLPAAGRKKCCMPTLLRMRGRACSSACSCWDCHCDVRDMLSSSDVVCLSRQTSPLYNLRQVVHACLTFVFRRSPWVLPVEAGARRAAAEVRKRLSEDAGGGSDHLALVRMPTLLS